MRNDFKEKSSRTYDNEKRRIESYMGNYMKWDYTKSGKKSFISMNCSEISTNPLYAAWKSKTFTDKDIILHFYILSILENNSYMSVDELTNEVCLFSELTFDIQTVRNKCNEYVKEGLLTCKKEGRALHYKLSDVYLKNFTDISSNLIEAIKFFQGDTFFGEIGSFILDNNEVTNDMFLFKHYYVAHTLEDGILLDILTAIKNNKLIEFTNFNEAKTWKSSYTGVPLKIFVSATTGRRYVCLYKKSNKRFFNYRLDHIKSVKILDTYEETDSLKNLLDKNISKTWGVSFGGKSRVEKLSMKLYIDEKTEKYIIDRIRREGPKGKLEKVEDNIFDYTIQIFDTNDISPWIKTFMGRIIHLEGSNKPVINRFYNDIKKMREMYND